MQLQCRTQLRGVTIMQVLSQSSESCCDSRKATGDRSNFFMAYRLSYRLSLYESASYTGSIPRNSNKTWDSPCHEGIRRWNHWLFAFPRAARRPGFEATLERRRARLTSCQETGRSSHLDKRNKQHHVTSNSQSDLNSSRALYRCLTTSGPSERENQLTRRYADP